MARCDTCSKECEWNRCLKCLHQSRAMARRDKDEDLVCLRCGGADFFWSPLTNMVREEVCSNCHWIPFGPIGL